MDIRLFHTGPMMVNSYLCADEETKKGFIVDPGGPSRELDAFISKAGYKIEYIILTHGHGDHICGVPYYKEKFNAQIIGHHGDDYLFLDERENMSREFTGHKIVFSCDKYVDEGDIITAGSVKLQVFHTPGHTPGGISLLTDDVLFSGDTLFCQSIGRTDFNRGNFADLKKSIQTKLYVLPDDTTVLPGHEGTTTIGFEKKHNMFVKA